MIKILMLVAVAGLTTSVGVFLSAGRKKKTAVYGELYEFNERLLMNLKYSRRTVGELSQDFKYIPDIISGKTALDGEDGEFISEYFTCLGKSDALSQIDYLNERKADLKKRRDDSLADYKKYGSLYVKIFFMLGVLMAVLLA